MKKSKNIYGYKDFSTWKWRNFDGTEEVSIDDYVQKNRDRVFIIGTDSQNYRGASKCTFTSMLIAYNPGRGGTAILHKNTVPYMDNLRQRLLMEAMRSLELAWHVDAQIDSESVLTIHLDVNDSLKYKSGRYRDELVGLIVAQGFNARVKPDAWGASQVADLKC